MASIKGPSGLRGFTFIWVRQIVSQLGSAMIWFAFSIWAWKITGEATTRMVPKDQYARAEGMLGLTQAIPGILAPLAAAVLLGKIGFGGVMAINLLTYLAAFGTLLWVSIPQLAKIQLVQAGSFWKESLFGFGYIFERPGLRALEGVESYAFRSARHVEDLLPDYDGQPPTKVEAAV